MSGQAADLPGIWDALADAIDTESREAESLGDKPHWARLRGRVSQARYCAAQLRAALTAPPPGEAATLQKPGRPTTSLEDSLLRNIDGLNNLVRDMLQAFPDTADEQEWRDRAGALDVHDPDGQPYRAYTEEDM